MQWGKTNKEKILSDWASRNRADQMSTTREEKEAKQEFAVREKVVTDDAKRRKDESVEFVERMHREGAEYRSKLASTGVDGRDAITAAIENEKVPKAP